MDTEVNEVAQEFPTTGSTVIVDGFVVDVETGEILGMLIDRATTERFHVIDSDSAEWVLDKMQQNDAAIAALESRKRAIVANIDKMLAGLQSRQKYLSWRFTPELENFARKQLALSKRRSLATPFGVLAFRKTKRKVQVNTTYKDDAVAFLEVYHPALTDAIKVEKSVLVSKLPEDIALPPEIFTITPAGESFTINTGVKADKETEE